MSALSDQIDQIIRKHRLPFSIGEGNSAIARVLVNKDGEVVYDADNPPAPAPPGVLDFIALFDPNRTAPAELSMPWVTRLGPARFPGESLPEMFFRDFNIYSVRFDNLISIDPSWFIQFQSNTSAITEFHFPTLADGPSLAVILNFGSYPTTLTTMEFPGITIINGGVWITVVGNIVDLSGFRNLTTLDNATFSPQVCPNLVDGSLPKFASIINSGDMNFTNNPVMTTANFPLLTEIGVNGNFNISGCALTNLNGFANMRVLADGAKLQLGSNSALTDVSALYNITHLGSGALLYVGTAALSSSTVDALFNALATNLVQGSGATIYTAGQTPPAPPTSASSAARATLTTLGVTLTTD